MKYVMGIDIGTSATKTVLFDETCQAVAMHVLGRLGDDGVGLLPSEEIIGLGRGSPSVDFSGGMPSCARFPFTPSLCANV